MITLEVRCCYQPRKLLGWVDVPDDLARIGRRLFGMRLQRKPMPPRPWEQPIRAEPSRVERVAFAVDGYTVYGERPYPALKAEGFSVEELQELLGIYDFRPNNPTGVLRP